MFELLQAYETAKNERNHIFRLFYTSYVKHKLKKSFFKPFKNSINGMILNESLIEEFYQFFDCTSKNVYTGTNDENPYTFYASSTSGIYIYYDEYFLKFKFMENNCDINIEKSTGQSVFIHPENEKFYSGFFAEIIIMAIYNYCVSYIYGKYSKLYINHNSYLDKINSMYF